jgi:hypothetical protein
MLPGVYEFQWEASRLIFLGAFALVILTAVTALAVSFWRGFRDLEARRADAIRWAEDFHDLPEERRVCRHAYDGRIPGRVCPNGFDCRGCERHEALLAAGPRATVPDGGAGDWVEARGLALPADRFYHRGHTWIRPDPDGTVAIGPDELAARVVGGLRIVLPAPGTRLEVNGTAWHLRGKDAEVRMLSPVEGEVIAAGGPGRGFWLRVRPAGGALDLRHLLTAAEAAPWMVAETDRLQSLVADRRLGPTLADGGEPCADLAAAIPAAQRDAVLGDFFLDT